MPEITNGGEGGGWPGGGGGGGDSDAIVTENYFFNPTLDYGLIFAANNVRVWRREDMLKIRVFDSITKYYKVGRPGEMDGAVQTLYEFLLKFRPWKVNL